MSESEQESPRYSVIVPVGGRTDDLAVLVTEYVAALDALGSSYEIIVVFDGPRPNLEAFLESEIAKGDSVRVVELTREFGEAAALMAGFDHASGTFLVTLPAYYQVDPEQLEKLFTSVTDDDDMLIAVRWPRTGSGFDKWRREAFHRLFELVSRMRYRDLGCGVRLFRRSVAEEIPLYGDQHRFLPALASRRGFRVREIEVAQSKHDRFRGRYRLREYLHRFLDILTVFFLVRFTKKPLRFFGTIGFIVAGIGGLFVTVMVVQRLFFGVALGDRPALLLASLLVVLGVQVMAIGLIGELIIFTHASQMKEYAIRAIFGSGDMTASEHAIGDRSETAASRESRSLTGESFS